MRVATNNDNCSADGQFIVKLCSLGMVIRLAVVFDVEMIGVIDTRVLNLTST